jgi:hypothetical protein
VSTQTPDWIGIIRSASFPEIPGLSYERNKVRQIGSKSAYNSENMTEADEAWRNMLTGHGVISLPEDYAENHKLVETSRHPIEPDGEPRRTYVVEAYHAMHCLVSQYSHVPPKIHTLTCIRSAWYDFITEHMKPVRRGTGLCIMIIIASILSASTSCAILIIHYGTPQATGRTVTCK